MDQGAIRVPATTPADGGHWWHASGLGSTKGIHKALGLWVHEALRVLCTLWASIDAQPRDLVGCCCIMGMTRRPTPHTAAPCGMDHPMESLDWAWRLTPHPPRRHLRMTLRIRVRRSQRRRRGRACSARPCHASLCATGLRHSQLMPCLAMGAHGSLTPCPHSAPAPCTPWG
jgi:hypothetical protein